jgi:hypothetical protein
VYHERGDIGVTAGNEYSRYQLIDMTTPIEYQSIIMVTGKHFELLSWRLLSITFRKFVWICLGISFLTAVTLIFLAQIIYKSKIVVLMSEKDRSQVFLWKSGRIIENIYGAFFEEHIPTLSPFPLRFFLGYSRP